MKSLKKLQSRVLELSFKHKLSHIGSCLTMLPILVEVYELKRPEEKVILSAGHAHIAHLVVKEYFENLKDIDNLIDVNGVHCDRSVGCDVSTGSLGHGIGIAVGMALADRKKNVYCLISDGECAEGSVWEAIRIWKREKLRNLRIYLNFNGYAAYKQTYLNEMPTGVKRRITNYDDYPFLTGLDAHYYIPTKENYESL